jgi:phosphogluconate dehydratase
VPLNQAENEVGFGRELFGVFRAAAAPAEQGASVFGPMVGEHAAAHGEHAASAAQHGEARTSTTQAG